MSEKTKEERKESTKQFLKDYGLIVGATVVSTAAIVIGGYHVTKRVYTKGHKDAECMIINELQAYAIEDPSTPVSKILEECVVQK